MSSALWIAVGVTCYLGLASLGLLLCRGIAVADRVATGGSVRSTLHDTFPRPRSSTSSNLTEGPRRASR